jgi:hypothetical protein
MDSDSELLVGLSDGELQALSERLTILKTQATYTLQCLKTGCHGQTSAWH